MEQIPNSLVQNVLNYALRNHFDSFSFSKEFNVPIKTKSFFVGDESYNLTFNYDTNEFLKCFRWSDNKNIPLITILDDEE